MVGHDFAAGLSAGRNSRLRASARLARPQSLTALAGGFVFGSAMNAFIEIRAGEGGDDAKSLVREQLAVYAKVAKRRGL